MRTAQQQQARASADEAAQSAEQAASQAQSARDAARTQIQTQTRDQIRQQVRDAIRGVNDATSDVANDASISVGTSAQDGLTKTITFPDGNGGITRIRLGREGIQVGTPGSMATVPFDRIVPRGIVTMTYAMCLTMVLVFVGGPIARAFARRMDRKVITPNVPPEVLQRLAAIEHAVDTVAVEVERISEGQRFTTKLLSERTHEPAPDFSVAARGTMVERHHG